MQEEKVKMVCFRAPIGEFVAFKSWAAIEGVNMQEVLLQNWRAFLAEKNIKPVERGVK